MTNKIEWVKLEAPVQLTPKEYRLKLVDIAAQVACIPATNLNLPKGTPVTEVARVLLANCGIEEALVPKQHAAELEAKEAALAVLYPDKEGE